MLRRSSSEKSPLVRYRSRPPTFPIASSHHLLSADLEGSSSDGEEEDTNEQTRLMQAEAAESDEPHSIRIDVPEFPIATATFRRPRSGSTIGSRHGSSTGPFPHGRRGRRLTLNIIEYAKEEREARRQSLAQLKLSYYPKNEPDAYDDGLGFCGWFMLFLSYILLLATFPISICFCIKVVQEYERAVEILTRDSVTISVDAVVYYRIVNPTTSIANVENAHHSTRLLAQTALRNLLGTRNLSAILFGQGHDRRADAGKLLLLDTTSQWGIKVERVENQRRTRLPINLQRAMAAEAEATREARAKIIAAEGEKLASGALADAANTITQSSSAIQLRYLQTLTSISAERNNTIVFPFPIELVHKFIGGTNKRVEAAAS
ncbi:PHB domain-containing protein [Aphelenchoides fujianensis]|nr:PHB domain-containing protein [Aphelenchoides fujianensis]